MLERSEVIADMAFGVALTLGITGTVLLLSNKKAEPAKAAPGRDGQVTFEDKRPAAVKEPVSPKQAVAPKEPAAAPPPLLSSSRGSAAIASSARPCA